MGKNDDLPYLHAIMTLMTVSCWSKDGMGGRCYLSHVLVQYLARWPFFGLASPK